ncbi:MAG TPA: DEAD/DEAH box helicase, partial [Actinomycetota bacterium]|nr:DEAD/DEAH box helicase [Actinomycetota bacterium]
MSARSEMGGMSAMSRQLATRFGIHVPDDLPTATIQSGHEDRNYEVWKALPVSWQRALLDGVFRPEDPDEREAQLDWLHASLAIEVPVEQLRAAAHVHHVPTPTLRHAPHAVVRPRRDVVAGERSPLVMREHQALDAAETRLAWERMSLRPWQADALEWWQDRNCNGVVEAVTGAGKTRVAIAAMLDSLEHGLPTLVIVPTIDLVRQWRKAIREALVLNGGLSLRIGVLGDASEDVDGSYPIVISTVHSVVSRSVEQRSPFLLVADEAHRYGSERFAVALIPTERRLGLTATLERMDDGVEAYLAPYFGAGSFRVGYERALAEDAIAPFRIAFVGVRFTERERQAFLRWRDMADDGRRVLVESHDFPEEPFGEFMKLVSRAAENPAHPASQIARRYLKAFQRTRAAMAEASGKLDVLRGLTPAVAAASRAIVFANTVEASSQAAGVLTDAGLSTGVLHAALDRDERRELLANFEDDAEDISVLAAPRLLDEGVDVAAADLGIVLASSRSRRQMIQRMGRVIRPKPDGRAARFAIVY